MELLHITFIHRHNLTAKTNGGACVVRGRAAVWHAVALTWVIANEKPTQQMTDPQTQPTIHACLRGSASARYSYLPIPLYTMQRVMGMWRL